MVLTADAEEGVDGKAVEALDSASDEEVGNDKAEGSDEQGTADLKHEDEGEKKEKE